MTEHVYGPSDRMPQEMVSALNGLTHEEIAAFNSYLEHFQRGLKMAALMQGGTLVSDQMDKARSMYAGAGLHAHLIGSVGIGAAFAVVGIHSEDNPMLLLAGDLRLELRDGAVVLVTETPTMDDMKAQGCVVEQTQVAGPDVAEMLRNIGIDLGDDEVEQTKPPKLH